MHRDIICTRKTLREGGIILYPTDTVWGIGCDATNVEAINRVNRIKNRQHGQPLLVLVDSVEMLRKYVTEIPDFVLEKLKTFQNPTTIIYPNAKNLPEILLGDNQSIGIRIVKSAFIKVILKKLEFPIVSTSANVSGQPTPKQFDDISPEIISQMDFVLPKWRERNAKASDIYKIEGKKLVKVR